MKSYSPFQPSLDPRTLRRLDRSFFTRPTLIVARELLGKFLVHEQEHTTLAARIIEVEAYLGERDPASHSYNGLTSRNEVMFRQGGFLYVYFTYGMHFCCNVVTGSKGKGRAVLLRALEPMAGIETMIQRRSRADLHNLCNGPAKICQSFGIGRHQNGSDLCTGSIWVGCEPGNIKDLSIGTSGRIGVSKAKKRKWRYFLEEHPGVSKGKPS